MSEIKGQLLGVILVLMIFGAVSAAMVAIFNGLTKTVEDQVSEIASTSRKNARYQMSELVSYK
jgi:Na+-translocating ferredoxin:NAD+ oxidoreductase RnfG subunit